MTDKRRDTSSPKLAADRSQDTEIEEDEDDDEDEDEDEEPDDDGSVNYSAAEVAEAVANLYHFTRPFLSAHRAGIILVAFGLLVETVFNVMMPLALKYLVDEVFETKDSDQFILILVVLGVAGLVASIVAIWYEWQDAKVTSAIVADVRRNLFSHIQKLPVSFYNRSKRGEVLSRFSNDMNTYEEAVLHLANWGVLPLLELMAGIALLLVLNLPLGMIALLIFPLVLVGPRIITPRAISASYAVRQAQASELGIVQENVAAQTVVKAYGLQGLSLQWFAQNNQKLRLAQQHSSFLNTLVERSITISVLWLHLIVLAVGAYLTFNDFISVGTFVAFESVFWEITYNLNHLTQYIPVMIDASGSVRHINELLHEPVRVSDKPEAIEAPRLERQISFQSVRFGYGNTGSQINDFDLSIVAGSRVAIVGPSGAGKSTLLQLLLRFYDPQRGCVKLDDIDIADVTRDSLRAQMAIVFQDNILFNASFRENIRIGFQDATDEQVEAAAKLAEIHRFILTQPHGYETLIGERGDTLSGGQRQRIAIARALLRDPAILLLDEATSALDQTTEAQINRTLQKVSRGRTTIFVTHRLTSITGLDEIIVLDEGRVVQRGKHEMLARERKGLYAKLWRNQVSGHPDKN